MTDDASQALIEVGKFIDTEVFGSPSNAEICGKIQTPTSSQVDLEYKNGPPAKVYERERRKRIIPLAGRGGFYIISASTFSTVVRFHSPFHRDLPPSTDQSKSGFHDVYAICQPDMLVRGFGRSFKHWSVYTQGHFYHLTCSHKSGDKEGPITSFGRANDGLEVVLKDENYTVTPNDAESSRQSSDPLQAYHIGQTDCTTDEIFTISQWIISRMQTYDFLSSNCQHFAFCLCMRILNRQCNHSVFIGTKQQITDFDRDVAAGNRASHQNTFHCGFLISEPRAARSGRWPEFWITNTTEDLLAHHLWYLWELGQDGKIRDDIWQKNFFWRHWIFIYKLGLKM
jgi:hypothetical protein